MDTMNSSGLALLNSVGSLDFGLQENVLTLAWAPGNGTLYKMIFTRLPETEGFPSGWLVTDLNIAERSMVILGDSLAHQDYVEEKLQRQGLLPQTVVINALLGDLEYATELLNSSALGG